jgi:hypothetical protein
MSKNISSEMAYPLHWPSGRERVVSYKRQRGRFKVTLATARDNAIHELRLLGAKYVVVSTNIPTRRDGLPYASGPAPADPAVAVYFDYKGDSHVFACDKWDKIEHNLQAVGKTVEALRGIKRWGSADMMKRAVNAFKALPASGDDWRSVLNVRGSADLAAVKARYRALAAQAHPDRGGSEHQMIRINQAWEAAQRELG